MDTSLAMLFVELNRRIIKVHAECHVANGVRASERAVRDRESCSGFEHPSAAHYLNPDVAAESPEELDGLRVALPNSEVV
jgi:hypothetical protein